jgi:hypothetical protein
MAKINTIYNPTKIVAADTAVNELEFGAPLDFAGSPSTTGPKNMDLRTPLVPSPSGISDQRITLLLKVTVGTFKFAVGVSPASNPATFTVGDTFSVTIHNRVMNLFFQATAPGDTFAVSA